MKVIIYCLVIVLAGCIGLYFLWNNANDPGLHAGKFIRKTNKVKLVDMKVIEIKNDFKILSGNTEQGLFFTSHKIGAVIKVDWNLQTRDSILFSIPDELSNKASNQFFTTIDSPYINFYANNLSSIIKCNFDNRDVKILKKPDEIFTHAVAIDSNSYVFRQGDRATRDQIFSVWRQGSQGLEKKTNFLEVLGDGGIGTDGILKADKRHNVYAYCYYYSNRFFIFDSTLSNVKKFKTIDSYDKFQVKGGDVDNGSYTNMSPAVFVNCCISIGDDLVYINSEVRAGNESRSQLRDSTAIDVYNIKNGEYLSSFYIPRINNERMSDLNVVGNKLIASFSDAVITANISHL